MINTLLYVLVIQQHIVCMCICCIPCREVILSTNLWFLFDFAFENFSWLCMFQCTACLLLSGMKLAEWRTHSLPVITHYTHLFKEHLKK